MSEWKLDDWREDEYLQANPDVREAVARGEVADGYTHWLTCGRFEDRPGSAFAGMPVGETRSCVDPWINAEFGADGSVKACCNYTGMEALDDHPDLETARRAGSFRELRHELLTGNLSARCRACHIRPMVPVKQFVQAVCGQDGGRVSPLNPGELTTARVDLNEKCNLRCVYCAVSQPSYAGEQMQDDRMEKLAGLLAGQPQLKALSVNGHGETTHHPRWREFCAPLLARGLPLTIITNLGRKLTTEDYDVLAGFRAIQVSLDTADADLLRAVRRKVELSRIVHNIAMIRTRALATTGRAPEFSFSAGLYDLSIARLEEFAWFTVVQGVGTVTFWNLKQYPDIPGEIAVRALDGLAPDKLREALGHFDRAMEIFDRFGVTVEIAGEFIAGLRAKAETEVSVPDAATAGTS